LLLRAAFAIEAGGAGHQRAPIMARLQIYQVLHVCSVITLIAVVFSAFAAPRPERKKFVMMLSGIAALVALISAFGMISLKYGNHFSTWMIVKAVVWLAIAALPGVVFRRPELAKLLGWVTAGLILVAVLMVYVVAVAV
jgi:CDP-diglyceride synthetase